MFYLFNSNNYLGGGETIFAKFASYLSAIKIQYELICDENSFLHEYAVEHDIPYVAHPINPIFHLPDQFLLDIPENSTVFICQLKDLYNLKYLCDGKNIKICYLYYHPNDHDYLDIWDLFSHNIKSVNLRNLAMINSSRSLFFPSSDYYDFLGFEDVSLNKAIPGFDSQSEALEPDTITKVLCISRFVDFKTGGILSLFILLRNFPRLECTIVGYGRFEFIVKAWLKVFRLSSRVVLAGKVDHHELGSYIDDSHICFTQGASLLQCVSFGKPTIILNYSSFISMFLPSKKCGGVWSDDSSGLGEFYHMREHDICTAFKKIEQNYKHISRQTIIQSNKMSEKMTFNFILDKLRHSKLINTDEIETPKIPILKTLYAQIKGFLNANL